MFGVVGEDSVRRDRGETGCSAACTFATRRAFLRRRAYLVVLEEADRLERVRGDVHVVVHRRQRPGVLELAAVHQELGHAGGDVRVGQRGECGGGSLVEGVELCEACLNGGCVAVHYWCGGGGRGEEVCMCVRVCVC